MFVSRARILSTGMAPALVVVASCWLATSVPLSSREWHQISGSVVQCAKSLPERYCRLRPPNTGICVDDKGNALTYLECHASSNPGVNLHACDPSGGSEACATFPNQPPCMTRRSDALDLNHPDCEPLPNPGGP